MKNQRSRFRLITFFLLCTFLAAVVFSARHAGLVSFSIPEFAQTTVPDDPSDNEAGDSSAAEESLNQAEPVPAEETAVPPSDNDLFDTTGL